LRALEQAGQRVPHLVHEGPDYLLLEHCGNTVANLLEDWTADTCRIEMENEARDLGAFHRAGQWHGASQIKNLTRHDGATWRIDFEEDFGELVPLPVVQALDIILFLNSVSLAGGRGRGRIPPAAAAAAGPVSGRKPRRARARDPAAGAPLGRSPGLAEHADAPAHRARAPTQGRSEAGAAGRCAGNPLRPALIGVGGAATCFSAGLRSGKTAP
jgi:hypothetical protein